jgi:integrase
VTVRELFQAYVDDLKRAGKRSWRDVERILLSETVGAARAIGADRPAADIEANDIVPHLAKIHDRGAIVMAHQARAFIGAAFAFGLKAAHDYTRKSTGADWGLKANPVLAIKADPAAHRTRDRHLSPGEFRAFWNWLIKYGTASSLSPVPMIMLATGQRTEEILRIGHESRYTAQQRMLSWDRTKNGLPHSIPLPTQAVGILDGLTTNEHGLYFPNQRHRAKPASCDGVEAVIDRYIRKTGAVHFCPRDIRRTWKTLSGEAGISKDMRDRLQNHAKGDISSRHYDRYEYLTERRAAMERWSGYLDRILAGEFDERPTAQIVAIGKAAA